jgi:hypothetical protein
VGEVPEEERFTRFLPAYKPESAYRKFVKKQAKVKIDGWLEVPAKPEGYSQSCFVVQMKGNAMSPQFSHNDWAIFQAAPAAEDAVGTIVIFQHPNVEDKNFGDNHLTIRRLSLERTKPKGSLFDSINVLLESEAQDYPTIRIPSITSDSDLAVVGAMISVV